MVSEWPYFRIEDVAEKVAMGPFGSSIKVSTFVPSGIPVISGQHLRGVKVEDSEFNFITEDHAEKLSNSNVQRGDVIFTHAGNIGQVAYIPDTSGYTRYVISQRQFYMRCNRAKVLPEFITYFFKTHEGQHKLLANRSSTGVPSIARPVTYLRSIEIPVPPLSVQQRIAHILGTLDDKIELNRRMNRTLEHMAAAIFKSWFIDFDPVRAKAEGQDTGLPEEISDLFPDSFEDSEIGPIPKGWKLVDLPDAIEVNPIRRIARGTPAPHVEMKAMPTKLSRPVGWPLRKFTSGSKFKNGDVLLARITPCLENGKTAFVDFLEEGQIGWGSTEYIVLCSQPPLKPEFTYLLARSERLREHAIANMTGTSGRQRVPASCFDKFPIAIPSEDVAKIFAEFVQPVFLKTRANDRQSARLAKLRDTLLPKLLSGELRVPDAQKLVEDTV